jgi:hypothetical protein
MTGEYGGVAKEVRRRDMRYGLDLPTTGPVDIMLGGRRRGPAWERERAGLAAVAEAGATWWGEHIPPDVVELDETRAHIERGPLRID